MRISPPHQNKNTYFNSSLQGHSSEEELGGFQPHGDGARAGKKTKGRVKIKMEFIDNKLRRYTTFSKRKTGIMKKVSESRKCLRLYQLRNKF